jgi:hypothetical protein
LAEDIRVTDLAHPVLTPAQQAAMDATRDLEVDLSRDGILAEARERAQLNEFGPDDFLERLDQLCDEWSNDKDLTPLCKSGLRNTLVMHATSRLLIHEQWQEHPEILDEEIRAPVIVVGLPRSGTTHLLNLMAADSRFRALPLWESYEPVAPPGERPTWDERDPRFQRCQAKWDGMQAMSPITAAFHPMNPEHIHEELELMGPDFASYNYEWLSHSPRWRDYHLSHDQTPHYRYMLDVLKLLQWQDRQRLGDDAASRRWVLKCPQHLEQLPVLTNVFPDATIAITHRDPVAVVQSSVMPQAYGQRTQRKRIILDELLEYWTDRIETLLRACVRDRPALDPERSIDVIFHIFMADDIGMVEKIYAKAGIEMNDTCRAELREFMRTHQRGKEGRIIYDLRGNFGVEPEEIRRRFQFYFDAFPVKAEVK